MEASAQTISAKLLAWYDASHRSLPWRSPPGTPPPEPYRVWLSEVMLQQTTVAAVGPYFEKFTTRWPTLEALAAADEADVMAAWAGLGYYSRARNLVACARAVAAVVLAARLISNDTDNMWLFRHNPSPVAVRLRSILRAP